MLILSELKKNMSYIRVIHIVYKEYLINFEDINQSESDCLDHIIYLDVSLLIVSEI